MRLRRSVNEDLRRVYLDHVEAVYAFCAYAVDRTTAEDITAATFERVIRSWRSYDSRRASERTWILTIARNLLTDHYRRQSHRQAVSTDEYPSLLAQLAANDDPAVQALATDALRAWLDLLGEREREVLALRYAGDQTASEIARITGLSSDNVSQIISRSLRKLRQYASAGESF